MDEGVPHPLRRALQEQYPEHEFISAQRQVLTGDSTLFAGLNPQQKDKRLLEVANERNFGAVITTDQGMEIQQNRKTPIHVITLDAGHEREKNYEQHYKPTIPDIKERLASIELSIANREPPSFTRIHYHEVKGRQALDDPPEPPEPTKPGAQKLPEAPAPPADADSRMTALEAEKARLRQQYQGTTEPQKTSEASQARPSALEAEKARIRQELMEQEQRRREAERTGRGGLGD